MALLPRPLGLPGCVTTAAICNAVLVCRWVGAAPGNGGATAAATSLAHLEGGVRCLAGIHQRPEGQGRHLRARGMHAVWSTANGQDRCNACSAIRRCPTSGVPRNTTRFLAPSAADAIACARVRARQAHVAARNCLTRATRLAWWAGSNLIAESMVHQRLWWGRVRAASQRGDLAAWSLRLLHTKGQTTLVQCCCKM